MPAIAGGKREWKKTPAKPAKVSKRQLKTSSRPLSEPGAKLEHLQSLHRAGMAGNDGHLAMEPVPRRLQCGHVYMGWLTFDVRGGPLAGRPLDGGVRPHG